MARSSRLIRTDGRQMTPAVVMLLALAPAAQRAFAEAPNHRDTGALHHRLDKILLDHKQSEVRLSARVVELPSGDVLYDHHGAVPLIPASNMKLVVMAASLDRLGEDFAFRTTLALRGDDLVVVGTGDPTTGDERLCRQRGEPITALFRAWAAQLASAGVKHVPGNLIVDDSALDQQWVHPRWPRDQFENWYEAPVGALNFNANSVQVVVRPTTRGKPASLAVVPAGAAVKLVNRTVTGTKQTVRARRVRNDDQIVVSGTVAREITLGPLTVRDPGLHFAGVLRATLAAQGIRVDGRVVRDRVDLSPSAATDTRIVDTHATPLVDVLGRAGKQSLGMMAEALIKALGRKERGAGTWEAGRAAVAGFMNSVGVPSDQYRIDDGSGLSRHNRLSAAATTQVLTYMFNAGGRRFEMLRDALSVAGVDGTMERRLRGAQTKGRVYAKTGYIAGVRTLAGYIQTPSGRWLAFAFFYNQARQTRPLTALQDRACAALVEWPGRG